MLLDDDAQSLYAKLEATAARQMEKLLAALIAGKLQRTPQDNNRGNSWRKRSARDGQIDWRMSASAIFNLVRALTRPYPGAHFVHGGMEIKVWRAEILNESESKLANIEPGKVLFRNDHFFDVRCGSGAIRVVEMEPALENLQAGDYL